MVSQTRRIRHSSGSLLGVGVGTPVSWLITVSPIGCISWCCCCHLEFRPCGAPFFPCCPAHLPTFPSGGQPPSIGGAPSSVTLQAPSGARLPKQQSVLINNTIDNVHNRGGKAGHLFQTPQIFSVYGIPDTGLEQANRAKPTVYLPKKQTPASCKTNTFSMLHGQIHDR